MKQVQEQSGKIRIRRASTGGSDASSPLSLSRGLSLPSLPPGILHDAIEGNKMAVNDARVAMRSTTQ